MSVRVEGLDSAKAALRRAMKDADRASADLVTVILAGISAATKPYVPVDTSTLINSETRGVYPTPTGHAGFIGYGGTMQKYTRGAGGPRKTGGTVSDYAVAIHEGPQKNWQKPGASSRFLAKGAEDFIRDDLSGILARFMR
jgi:hypothetical protein